MSQDFSFQFFPLITFPRVRQFFSKICIYSQRSSYHRCQWHRWSIYRQFKRKPRINLEFNVCVNPVSTITVINLPFGFIDTGNQPGVANTLTNFRKTWIWVMTLLPDLGETDKWYEKKVENLVTLCLKNLYTGIALARWSNGTCNVMWCFLKFVHVINRVNCLPTRLKVKINGKIYNNWRD